MPAANQTSPHALKPANHIVVVALRVKPWCTMIASHVQGTVSSITLGADTAATTTEIPTVAISTPVAPTTTGDAI